MHYPDSGRETRGVPFVYFTLSLINNQRTVYSGCLVKTCCSCHPIWVCIKRTSQLREAISSLGNWSIPPSPSSGFPLSLTVKEVERLLPGAVSLVLIGVRT